jgi:copper oxidase (laccase) domain-containing protein
MRKIEIPGANVLLSERTDGNMKFAGVNTTLEMVTENSARIQQMLSRYGVQMSSVAFLMPNYTGSEFCRYEVVDQSHTSIDPRRVAPKDGIATTDPNIGLLVAPADCLCAVLSDSEHRALMLSHLGRHSTEQAGAIKTVEFMQEKFDTDPKNLQVWLSPAVGQTSYPLYKLDGKGLREANTELLTTAGVRRSNIIGEDIDTATHPNFFSHSQGDTSQRFAVFARQSQL